MPAPCATAVAAGDFGGDGRCDLVLVCRGEDPGTSRRRVPGFEPKRFTDLDLPGTELAAAHLDSNGSCDLVVRDREGAVRC